MPSYTILLQRTFFPVSNLSLVSTHFLHSMQSPVSATAPSYKPIFSGITAKLSCSSIPSPCKSFTLLLFACWSGNKHKICINKIQTEEKATMKSSSTASHHPPSTNMKLEANTTALLISTSQPRWKLWTLCQWQRLPTSLEKLNYFKVIPHHQLDISIQFVSITDFIFFSLCL